MHACLPRSSATTDRYFKACENGGPVILAQYVVFLVSRAGQLERLLHLSSVNADGLYKQYKQVGNSACPREPVQTLPRSLPK
jgi:hypothetical protein